MDDFNDKGRGDVTITSHSKEKRFFVMNTYSINDK